MHAEARQRVSAIVLAGGKNSRMGGRDKAFLTVAGETVFSRILTVLQRCFDQVVVVSNTPEKYAGYPVEVTRDELPSLGPLSGLHAGLGRIRAPYAFVTACDMPFLREEPIRFLMTRVRDQEAIVPCWGGDIEPLHGIYAARLRSRVAGAVARGARAMRDFLPEARVEYIPEAVMSGIVGAEEALRNVNTPEQAARYAVQLEG